MAHRSTRRVRLAVLVAVPAVVGLLGVALPSLAAPAPVTHKTVHHTATRKLTIVQVQKRLGHLALRNDELVEKYNQAGDHVHAREAAALRAAAKARTASAAVRSARRLLAESAAAQYEAGTFSATGALLESDSGSNYLGQLQTLQMISSHDMQVVNTFAAAQHAAHALQARADEMLAAAQHERTVLTQQKKSVAKQISTYKRLLSSLSYNAREQFLRSTSPVATPAQRAEAQNLAASVASGPARTAIEFALNQVGKPYVWGAAGPGYYDCSGLTMASWAAAGVSLPHSSAGQYDYGTHVPATLASLQPGDLVFFYTPISHVTIYIGDGLMVSAPETGEDVSVVPLEAFSGEIVGATRLIG